MLLLVAYASKYHKAIPLWKATSKNTARELALLFVLKINS